MFRFIHSDKVKSPQRKIISLSGNFVANCFLVEKRFHKICKACENCQIPLYFTDKKMMRFQIKTKEDEE